MRSKTRLIVLSAVTALALSACGGGETTSSGDSGAADADTAAASSSAVTVTAKEFEFDPETLSFPSGTTVRLDNQGVIEHDFVVEGHEEEVEIYADAGTEAEGTVDLASGDYTFYCSIPGHRASGMEGSLTIE